MLSRLKTEEKENGTVFRSSIYFLIVDCEICPTLSR